MLPKTSEVVFFIISSLLDSPEAVNMDRLPRELQIDIFRIAFFLRKPTEVARASEYRWRREWPKFLTWDFPIPCNLQGGHTICKALADAAGTALATHINIGHTSGSWSKLSKSMEHWSVGRFSAVKTVNFSVDCDINIFGAVSIVELCPAVIGIRLSSEKVQLLHRAIKLLSQSSAKQRVEHLSLHVEHDIYAPTSNDRYPDEGFWIAGPCSEWPCLQRLTFCRLPLYALMASNEGFSQTFNGLEMILQEEGHLSQLQQTFSTITSLRLIQLSADSFESLVNTLNEWGSDTLTSLAILEPSFHKVTSKTDMKNLNRLRDLELDFSAPALITSCKDFLPSSLQALRLYNQDCQPADVIDLLADPLCLPNLKILNVSLETRAVPFRVSTLDGDQPIFYFDRFPDTITDLHAVHFFPLYQSTTRAQQLCSPKRPVHVERFCFVSQVPVGLDKYPYSLT